jgi:hypothetical protein
MACVQTARPGVHCARSERAPAAPLLARRRVLRLFQVVSRGSPTTACGVVGLPSWSRRLFAFYRRMQEKDVGRGGRMLRCQVVDEWVRSHVEGGAERG